MNGYLLLGEPVSGSSSPAYRGTYRPTPTYINELPVESPINQLWMQETELMIGDGFTNLNEAKRVQAIYAESGYYFDLVIIGAREWDASPEDDFQFIGYDISHISGYSLLSWDLIFDKPALEFFHQRDAPSYQPLLLLIQQYFHPQLNDYCLFHTVHVADFFLDVTQALTKGFGAVWESVEYGGFSVVKLYMVRSRDTMHNRV